MSDTLLTESLPVQLTPDELREFGQRAAREVRELADLQDEAKTAAANYKREIKENNATINALAHNINSGREYRPVAIYEVIERAQGVANVFRHDTDALVRTRPLSPSEMQTTMENLY